MAVMPLAASAQSLTHRYSFFNEPNGSTTATDVVAAANGTLKGGASITGGQLVLNGASGNYASLPGGLITGYSVVTVEAWADYGTLPANCYLFSFGNTDGSGLGEDYIFCAPQAARITISGVDPGYNSEQNATCANWSGRNNLHVVAVFNPPAGYMALYTNGILAAVNNSVTVPMSSVNNAFSYIGKSLYNSDPYAPIKVDEFRIWNGALNGLQAAADYLAGPTVTNANPGTVTNIQLTVAGSVVQGAKQNATVIGKASNIPYTVDITRICAYSSGDTNVLTVNPTNGLITAAGPGTNVIVAQYGSVSSTQSIVVVPPVSTLTHRYSFFGEPNGSLTATDSIAAANGTLKGGAVITSGQLVLNGASGTYVNLPANLINSGYSGVTIETWASFAPTLPVSFLFGFGNTNGPFGTNYIFCTAQLGRSAITPTTYYGEQGVTTGGWAGQTNLHVVTVFEPPVGYVAIYTNGALAGINNSVTTPLSAVNDVYSFIGRSLFSGDSYLPGSMTEFRIYNGPLSAQQIALDAATGPAQIITSAGALQSVQLLLTSHLAAGVAAQAQFIGNFANVSNVNLFTYGAPAVVTDNSNVLSVTASGLITAITPGATANVIASYGGLSATQSVTVAGFATNQFVFDSFGDGFWTIANQGNGNNLVANNNGASQATAANTAAQQQFELLYNLDTASFRIRQHSSWLCVGTWNGITAPGAAVATVPNYTAAASQRWYFVNAGGGYYRIFNAATNLVLQTDNGNPAVVTLAQPSPNAFQLWQFVYQTHYPKKGTAGYEGDWSPFELTWAYNYDDHTGVSLPAQVNFVPMIHDANWEPMSDVQSRSGGWRSGPQPAYLLTYNEPDNSTQANMSTNQVIGLWPQLQALNVPLVSPAMQNTYDSWAYNFFSLIASNNYRVDYTAVHLYVPPNASSLINNLHSVYTTWNRPVWLTEFSPVDWSNTMSWSEDDNYNFLAEFMWQAEDQEWFKRYSIFPFSGTPSTNPWDVNGHRGDFFLADGSTLTPYGELYATWDADRALHGLTPYIIHNLATSFRLASSNSVSSPASSSIRVRNATTEWCLLPAPNNNWYIISLSDGRRLSDTNGVLGLAAIGTVGSAVEWNFTGPDGSGYYFVGNPAGAHNLNASGTAPAISFSTVSSSTQNNNTRWRFVKPYQPVAINTNVPTNPSIVFATAGDGTVSMGWTTGGGAYFNVYRGIASGGPYSRLATGLTHAAFLDNTCANGNRYYYVVTAMNLPGVESGFSAEASAQPVSMSPPQLGFGIGGGGILLNWPVDHTGWELQAQTNSAGVGLGGAWVTVAGSTATNQITLPLDPVDGSIFYRLVYP